MAGNSFIDGTSQAYSLDLDLVSQALRQNPYVRSRSSTPIYCDDGPDGMRPENSLVYAKRAAETGARQLSRFHDGRVLLERECTGENAIDPEYWLSRAAYFSTECEKLRAIDDHRASRSITPEIINPSLYATELERARCSADNCARLLLRFPAGKALVEAECSEPSTVDVDYWRNKKEFFETQIELEFERTKEGYARNAAESVARELATFPAGKALLEAEDQANSKTCPIDWQSRKDFYQKEYDKLEQGFWDRWKRTHMGDELDEAGNSLGDRPSRKNDKLSKGIANLHWCTEGPHIPCTVTGNATGNHSIDKTLNFLERWRNWFSTAIRPLVL